MEKCYVCKEYLVKVDNNMKILKDMDQTKPSRLSHRSQQAKWRPQVHAG